MQLDLLDPTHNAILATTTYADFAESLRQSNCQRCPLAGGRKTIVVDRGNPSAKIMVVSERPGAQENETGLAFVGRAGELLDKIFTAIGLDSNRDLLIVNIVKCMPPVERAPHAEEAEACLPYLEKQMALVKPKVLLLLGAIALKCLDPEGGEFAMEEKAGQWLKLPRYPDIPCMVLYHPAFLLRDPTKKKIMWEHVQALKRWLDQNG